MRTSRVVRRAGAALLCLSLLTAACTSDEGSDDDGPDGSEAPAGTVLGDGDAYEATIVRTDRRRPAHHRPTTSRASRSARAGPAARTTPATWPTRW